MDLMKELLATQVPSQITESSDVDMDFNDLLEKFRDEAKLHRLEGRSGVIALARIAAAIGYKDSQHFGQLTREASIGDLINFLEDNSGAIEAVLEFIIREGEHSEHWKDSLKEEMMEQGWLGDPDDHEE